MNRKDLGKRHVPKLLVALLILMAVQTVTAAALLAVIQGPELEVINSVTGVLQYFGENEAMGSWDLAQIPVNQPWYVRLVVTEPGFAGEVSIAWFIQEKTDATWNNLSLDPDVTTTCVLTGEVADIRYASVDGEILTNMDWSTYTTTAGTYRVVAEVSESVIV